MVFEHQAYEPPLADKVAGTSGFAEEFAQPGPFDGRGVRYASWIWNTGGAQCDTPANVADTLG
jgi:hypothetical protein